MKEFTLQQIAEIIRDRHCLTKERFYYYFPTLFEFDMRKTREYWKIYESFPSKLCDPGHFYVMEDIIEKSSEVLRIIRNESIPYSAVRETNEARKQIHYKIGEDIHCVEINLNKAADVIMYAKILEKEYEVIALIDFIEKIPQKHNEPEMPVYDGDIFVTMEGSLWNRERDNIYVCDKGTYKQLLYTKGKGYMRDGKPDYDPEANYNYHALTLNETFTKVGNIYIDCSILSDKK